jgi:hypothetical protein
VLGALLGVLQSAAAPDQRAARRAFICAGLSAGVGLGLKYTTVVFVPGLAVVALVAALRRRRAAGNLAIFAGVAAAGFLAFAGHHLLTLWRDFGNPVFPLLNNIFQSPAYEPVSIRDDQFLPRNVWQLIAYPYYWVKTHADVVSELPMRDWRGAMAYIAVIAAAAGAVRRLHNERRPDGDAETRGLDLVVIFAVVSYFAWASAFGNYRYGLPLEMLTGVVIMGALIVLARGSRLRIGLAIALLAMATASTVYPDWGRSQYGDRYIDVRVPPLPKNSVVLIASWQPAAFFIPFAEPTAQYLGIENNYLELSQHNGLATEVKRLMRAPGRPKFVVSVGEFNAGEFDALLAHFDLKLGSSPCQPIWSNLKSDALSLCPAVPR